ncbi:MAG: hypothetical protein OXF52_02390 [Candidatus Dadabacteria bacterium]|nr:hypothetical protein [Candidatus Dadabacteria bacterium]
MKRFSKVIGAICLCVLVTSCAGRIAEPTQTKIIEPDGGEKSISLYHFYKKETFGQSGWQVAGEILAAGAVGALAGATSAGLDSAGFQDNQLMASMVTSTWIAGDMVQQKEFQRIVLEAVDKIEMNPSAFRLKYTQKGMIWSRASREIAPVITVQDEQVDTYGQCFVDAAIWYSAAEVGCGHLFGAKYINQHERQMTEDNAPRFGKCVSDALDAHVIQMQQCRILTAPQQQDYLTAFVERAKEMKKIVNKLGANYAVKYYGFSQEDKY